MTADGLLNNHNLGIRRSQTVTLYNMVQNSKWPIVLGEFHDTRGGGYSSQLEERLVLYDTVLTRINDNDSRNSSVTSDLFRNLLKGSVETIRGDCGCPKCMRYGNIRDTIIYISGHV